mmetsp:Transcript_10985/g.11099  ORF Transcript_10985/g.11099 Transcript_10985/m.11099 type:complete len:164 (+) Transcript_10985:155-646(+)
MEGGTNKGPTLFSQMVIRNVNTRAAVAFFVFTSAPYPIKIQPKHGFIRPHFQQEVNIGWEPTATSQPDEDRLAHAMFFVKCLPLSTAMDLDDMNEHITEVFNPYNINILFTVSALPSRVSAEWQLMQIQMKNNAQIQKHDKENSLSMPDVIAQSSVGIKAAVT